MAQALVKNNAYSTLAAGISSSATSLTVATGQGARFPVITSGNFFFATLVDTSNNLEVIKVIATATDVFTIVRGQDSTTARAYLAGDRIELRPTAALFNDKLSVGGGTLTGHIEAIAGATGSQIPRVSEVVKKAGDTMTGALTVPELRGPSNEIAIPAGHRIDGASAGALVAPGMVVQTVLKRTDVRATYSVTDPGTVDLAELTQSFTPVYSNSKILLQYSLTGECNNNDSVFLIKRDGAIVGRNTSSSAIWSGFAIMPNDNNATNTPLTIHLVYVDTPGTTSAVEYALAVQPSNTGGAVSFFLNRSVGSAGGVGAEIGISQLIIQEIAQ